MWNECGIEAETSWVLAFVEMGMGPAFVMMVEIDGEVRLRR